MVRSNSQHWLIFLLFYWTVPYFRDLSLDTDPYFDWYEHFCNTIIDVCTDRNTYKRGMQHYLIKRCSAVDNFYFKSYFSWRDMGTSKCIKNIFCCKNFFKEVQLKKNLVFSWIVWDFGYFAIIYYIAIFYV